MVCDTDWFNFVTVLMIFSYREINLFIVILLLFFSHSFNCAHMIKESEMQFMTCFLNYAYTMVGTFSRIGAVSGNGKTKIDLGFKNSCLPIQTTTSKRL